MKNKTAIITRFKFHECIFFLMAQGYRYTGGYYVETNKQTKGH